MAMGERAKGEAGGSVQQGDIKAKSIYLHSKDVMYTMNKELKMTIFVLSAVIVVSVIPGCVDQGKTFLPSPTPTSSPVSLAPAFMPPELPKAPSTILVAEGAQIGSKKITLIHHGGDTISNAFKGEPPYWNSLVIKKNGVAFTGTIRLNGAVISAGNFAPGDELELFMENELTKDDIITVIHVPSESLLMRLKMS
jgi:hypothetical protein